MLIFSGGICNTEILEALAIPAKDETFIFSGFAPQPAERKCPLVPNESLFDEEKSNVRMHCAAPCLFDSFVLVFGQQAGLGQILF